MILAGALLHWLASQSIFVVSVEWWANVSRTVAESTEMQVGEWGRDDWHDFATCGYSPLALFIFIIFAAVFFGSDGGGWVEVVGGRDPCCGKL